MLLALEVAALTALATFHPRLTRISRISRRKR
jgi:hypothetical protein